MCGLYSFRRGPEEARRLFACKDGEPQHFAPRPYIGPGQPIGIVRMEEGRRIFALVHWGFIPSWTKEVRPGRPLANARAETVLDKPSFRNAMRRRRCLVPADGFFQWKGEVPGRKQPYFVHRPDEGLFAIAGLWETWAGGDGSEIDTALFITVPANERLAAIHHRMPALIKAEDFDAWLDSDRVSAEDAARLLKPVDDDYLAADPADLSRPSRDTQARPPRNQGQLKLL
jgi:putative SOS response-associated peptidase YedK